MSLKSPFCNTPVPTPDDKPHLFYTHFTEKSLTVRVNVCGGCEEIVCFYAAVKELAEDAYYCEGSSYSLCSHCATVSVSVSVSEGLKAGMDR